MAAPNMNGRLHITDVHQKPPADLEKGREREKRHHGTPSFHLWSATFKNSIFL